MKPARDIEVCIQVARKYIPATADNAETEIQQLRTALAEARKVIKPFAIDRPIGIPSFWMGDFVAAAEWLAKYPEEEEIKEKKHRKPRDDKYNPRDIAILGGDPSL